MDENEEFEFRARAEREAAPQDSAPAVSAPQQAYGMSDFLKDTASNIIRPIAKGVAALPLMAMDAGVGARNLVTGSTYQLPSQMFNNSLDEYTRPPDSAIGRAAEAGSAMVAGGVLAPQAQATTKLMGGRDLVPQNFMQPRQAARAGALAVSNQYGLVAPPSQSNPTLINRLLEGISGKVKLNQEATLRNDPIFSQIAAKELGQNPEAPLSQGALQSIRTEAATKGYAPLRDLGEIKTTKTYTDALDNIAATSRNAARSFPGLKTEDVEGVTKPLRVDTFNSADGIDAIQNYRAMADQAYRRGDNILGKAYKASSKALEDAIEQHLVDQGGNGSTLLAAFRDARVQIAKTYDVGKALNESTGQINAQVLGRLDKAKPGRLSGGLKDIATFAQAFPKASVMPKEDFPAISPLDAYGSAMAAGATHSVGPLMIPLSRVGIREYLLSMGGQARAVPSVPADSASALKYGLIPQLTLSR